jgi:integrase
VAADERNLRLHILPRWGKRDYTGSADVIALVEGVIAADKQTLANRLQGLISKIYSFAIDAGLVDVNPCARMAQRGVEKAGTRVLSDGELCLFWAHIVEPPDMRRAGLGLRLALLTGARVSEIAGVSRNELFNIENASGGEWLLPGSRVKNKRDHPIPLAPLALATMRELVDLTEPREQFLFPSGKSRPVNGNTLTQFMVYFATRLKRGDFGDHGEAAQSWLADPPSPHDLRRTVETRLAELGVPKEYRDKVLNHVTPGVAARHYDRHHYKSEKLAALSKWEGLLQSIFAGEGNAGTVVALADRRGV